MRDFIQATKFTQATFLRQKIVKNEIKKEISGDTTN